MLGVAVPFAALWSLYNLARREIRRRRVGAGHDLLDPVSQMAGGVLTILIIPLLRFVAPTGPWVTIAAVLLFAFGLLMPIAFAAGVWKYRVLDLDPDAPPASEIRSGDLEPLGAGTPARDLERRARLVRRVGAAHVVEHLVVGVPRLAA